MMLDTPIRQPQSYTQASPLFDEDGYLLNQDLWSERLAVEIAEMTAVGPLTDNHWRLLHHVRQKYFRIGAMPSPRRVCRETGLSQSEILRLFGGCLVIWRIAGLPNPGEEAKAYLGR